MKSGHPQIKLGIGVVCYIEDKSELPELKRCLDSLESFYPVIIIDGRWNDFKGKYSSSIQEAVDIINSYSNTIHIISANNSEAFNRNLYLINAARFNLDYIMTVDTDEYVVMYHGKDFFLRGVSDVFHNKKELSCYIHCYGKQHGGVFRTIKILKDPNSLEYHEAHNRVYHGNTNIISSPLMAPRGLILYHDKEFRGEKREGKMINRIENNIV